jgi:DNA-binding response OmpR family regulator
MGAPVVLVVEDDDSIREVLVDVLSAAGYCVVGARDGIAALGYLDDATVPPAVAIDKPGVVVIADGELTRIR